jgi:RNA polymerase sigma-70 factor (ECF subfamily)
MLHEDEGDIREAWERGAFDRVTELVLERYGPSLFGYLSAHARERAHAREIFSILAEDLWIGIPTFAWRCTIRAWAYKLARSARARYSIAEARRARVEQLLGHPAWFETLVHQTRSPTPPHLRTDVKDQFRELRSHLGEDEQTLLMLRVDRGLSWQELAVVLDEVGDGETTTTASARLRQRFVGVKEKLRDIAKRRGMIPEHEH